MEKAFTLEQVDEGRRFVETRMLEWDHAGLPHRTRIAVGVVPEEPGAARVEVLALKIEPAVDFEHAEEGVPLYQDWRLEGKLPEVEEVVSGQILRRYLLLREGKDPDTVPLPEGPIPGLSRR